MPGFNLACELCLFDTVNNAKDLLYAFKDNMGTHQWRTLEGAKS